jgi:hypothetical protein
VYCRCRLRSTTLDSEVREVLRTDILGSHKAPATAASDAATIAAQNYCERADRVKTDLHRSCLTSTGVAGSHKRKNAALSFSALLFVLLF